MKQRSWRDLGFHLTWKVNDGRSKFLHIIIPELTAEVAARVWLEAQNTSDLVQALRGLYVACVGRNIDVWPGHFCQGITFSLAGELYLVCLWELKDASVYFLVGSFDF